jgi:hypothetical protein
VQKNPEADLVRGIRRWDLVAITINGIIGAGIFGLPSKVYSLIGTYSIIAFVVDHTFTRARRSSLRSRLKSAGCFGSRASQHSLPTVIS